MSFLMRVQGAFSQQNIQYIERLNQLVYNPEMANFTKEFLAANNDIQPWLVYTNEFTDQVLAMYLVKYQHLKSTCDNFIQKSKDQNNPFIKIVQEISACIELSGSYKVKTINMSPEDFLLLAQRRQYVVRFSCDIDSDFSDDTVKEVQCKLK